MTELTSPTPPTAGPPKDNAWLVIAAAIAYALLPLDLVPDAIPGFGELDDLGVTGVALAVVAVWRRGGSWRDLVPLLLPLAYDLFPFDLIPDVPVVGQLDDLIATAIGFAVWWSQRKPKASPQALPPG